MDRFENYAENCHQVEENVQNCDEWIYADEREKDATQEGVQVENTAPDSITTEASNLNEAFVDDDGTSRCVEHEKEDSEKHNVDVQVPKEDIRTIKAAENTTSRDTDKEDLSVRETQEPVLKTDTEADHTKKRLRKKKKYDRENVNDTENEGSVERLRRRKKKKRKSRDTLTETNHVAKPVATNADTGPPLSPSHDAGYDSLGSCFKDSNGRHRRDPVVNTQNAQDDRNSKPRQNRDRHLSPHGSRMYIFTVQKVQSTDNGLVMEINETDAPIANEGEKKKKKKKKKLHGLKKTKGAVGILPPPVQPAVTSARQDTQEEKPKEGDKDADGDKLVTDDKATAHPTPLWPCRVIAGYPVTSFLVVSLLHLAVFATTAGLVFNGYDVFPLVFDTLPLYIYEDVHLKELTWKSKTQYDGYVWRPVYGANIARGTRSQVKDSVEVIFERQGVNLLDKEHLQWIKRMEDRLFNNQLFQDEFCMLDYYRNCISPQSILRFFDGTYSDVDQVFLDPDFSNIPEVIYKAYEYNETRDYLHMFMSKKSIITRNFSSTDITRSVFLMGWPLGVVNLGGRRVYGNLDTLTDFLSDVFRAEIEDIRDHILVDFIDVYYLSKILYEHDLVQQALKDIMLAIGSVSFIFVFVWFQTRSFTITFLGVLSIGSSFLLTNLIYRYVFQYKYFGFFHVIALFLILGIGADDLFVFYDTWRLTGKKKYPSDAHRLSDCFRKAAKTTFVTSCTTVVAFLVSGLSPLLPVRTFGIFAGVLVAIDYVWVIIYFPSIIIIHHKKVKPAWHKFHRWLLSPCLSKNWLSSRNRRKSDISSISSDLNSTRSLIHNKTFPETVNDHGDTTNKDRDDNFEGQVKQTSPKIGVTIDIPEESYHNDLNKISIGHDKSHPNGVKLDLRETQVQVIQEAISEKRKRKQGRSFQDRNRVVRFLKNSFFFLMTSRVVKVTVPLVILGVSIFFIHRATLIEPDTQQLRLWRDDHNYAKATDRHYTAFIRNNEDEYQRVYLIWGLLPADISDCNIKSADYCFGKPQYDDRFDMNTQEAQIAFKGLCENLDSMPDSLVESLHIRRDTVSGKPQISCFTKAFEKYYQNEARTGSYPSDFRMEVPVTTGNVSTLMSSNSAIYRYSLPNGFNNQFEIPISYWLTNAYKLTVTPDYFLYNHLLAEKRTSQSLGAYYSSSGLYYGTKLQYLAIEINTTLNLYQLGYKEGLPIYDNWENLITSINNGFPEPLQRGMQVSETLWHWLHVQETLANSAIMGILVGLTTAWPILVLTTFNVVIGTLATATIGLVTACVVGLIPLVGWKLGVLESINLCMVVGLSVDYVVHLAEAYRMSESDKRLDRVRSMLESIGLSVVSGAITTIGAAIFMLFAEIRFFYQFGIFIISTVGISLVFSLFGYTTFMSLCGPQYEFGSLKYIVLTVMQYCKANPNKSEKTSCACICASPSEIVDRIYDRLSYGHHHDEDCPKQNEQDTSR